MATAGNLCTTIIGDLQRSDTSLSDVVLLEIQGSIREYENTRFFFNELLMTLTLSATDTYALSLFVPTGISDVIEVDNYDVIINSSRKYPLTEINMRSFVQYASGASGISGYPEFYSIFNQAIKIYPTASGNYVSELWGHVKFTEIAAAGFSTTNVWTNEASELIRHAALKRLWAKRYKDPESASFAAEAERLALRSLLRKTEGLSTQAIPGYL